MARGAVRNAKLDTKDARLKLEAGVRHFGSIGEAGVAIGYRRATGKTKKSAWLVRYTEGDNKYKMKTLANTDDYQDANGKTVLNYSQATKSARELVKRMRGVSNLDYTVRNAFDDYLEWYILHGNNGKGGKDRAGIKTTAESQILPVLGDYKIVDLSKDIVKKWRDDLVKSPAQLRSGKTTRNVKTQNDPRARKATVNRILTILKAALNVACFENHIIDSDLGWRTVRPFKNVDAPREAWFTESEAKRLINACEPDLRQMVIAALFTGCRYGEIAAARVEWFDPENGLIHLLSSSTKNGEARDSFLSDDGIAFFKRAVIGKAGDDLIFTHADGRPWGRAHQSRPMKVACENAAIKPTKGFHILRHSYATAMINRGVPIEIVAQCIGDKDLRTAKRHYAHLMSDVVRNAVRNHLPSFSDPESDNVVALKG